MTTTDINIDGVKYIAEVKLDDSGNSELYLTEVCNHLDSERDNCTHKTYNFKEATA